MTNTITTTGLTINYELAPTKKDIVSRLFQEGHISFDEMWTLLQNENEVRYIPMPIPQQPIVTPYPYPNYPWGQPYYTTCVENLNKTTTTNE